MTSAELENLVRVGQIKREVPVASEIAGLVRSGEAPLADADNRTLSLESRFDLAYNAAHALALAALRLRGYRPENRYLVFQLLPETLGLAASVWRVLSKCHEARNAAEYEGAVELDERLVTDLLEAARAVRAALRAAGHGVDPGAAEEVPARPLTEAEKRRQRRRRR